MRIHRDICIQYIKAPSNICIHILNLLLELFLEEEAFWVLERKSEEIARRKKILMPTINNAQATINKHIFHIYNHNIYNEPLHLHPLFALFVTFYDLIQDWSSCWFLRTKIKKIKNKKKTRKGK